MKNAFNWCHVLTMMFVDNVKTTKCSLMNVYCIDGVEQQIIIYDHCIYMCSCSLSTEPCCKCKGASESYNFLYSPERAAAHKTYEQKSNELRASFPHLSSMNPKTQYGYSQEYDCAGFGFTKEYQDAHEAYLLRTKSISNFSK